MVPRRRILVSVGLLMTVGGAGCLEDDDPASPTPSPTESTPTPTPTPTPEVVPTVSATLVQDHDEAPLIEATVTQPVAYDFEEPVVIEVTLTNDHDKPIVLHDSRPALFWDTQSDSFGLYPSGVFDAYTYDERSGVWHADEPYLTAPGFQSAELAPGETESDELILLALPTADSIESYPSSIAFETTYGVEVPTTDGKRESLTVSATLTLMLTE